MSRKVHLISSDVITTENKSEILWHFMCNSHVVMNREMQASLAERSLLTHMVAGEAMEAGPSLVRTTLKWTVQEHMQPAGWPNLLSKPNYAEGRWCR